MRGGECPLPASPADRTCSCLHVSSSLDGCVSRRMTSLLHHPWNQDSPVVTFISWIGGMMGRGNGKGRMQCTLLLSPESSGITHRLSRAKLSHRLSHPRRLPAKFFHPRDFPGASLCLPSTPVPRRPPVPGSAIRRRAIWPLSIRFPCSLTVSLHPLGPSRAEESLGTSTNPCPAAATTDQRLPRLFSFEWENASVSQRAHVL